jgi:type IX secretion system PorP/SprF family membrane protein
MVKLFINVLFIKILLFSFSVNAQDVEFSQLFADRMYLNPAYAGMDYCPRFLVAYRNQWPGVQLPYVTYTAAFDKYIESLHGGIGIRIMKDDQGGGVFNQLSADLIYAYKTKIFSDFSLSFALEVSLFQKSLNTRDLTFYNMIDPVQGAIYPNTEYVDQEKFNSIDFSSGILLNYKRNFIGFSASHIPQNMVANHNEYLPLKLTANIVTIITFDKNDTKRNKFILEPNIVFIRQQNMNMLYSGTYFDINQMSFGLFLRQNFRLHLDALVASYHLQINKLELGYSYDITLSKFYGQTLGSHELSIIYILPCDKKIRKYNTISCPSF